jgi:hypothetical protein
MPPRRSTRVAAAAESATTALSPLPLTVVLHIFSLLPVDCRLRCMEVCRGWRSVLLERSLWTRLELTAASGVRQDVGWGRLLRCAAARAGGALHSLHVDNTTFSYEALLEVAAANAGALCELRLAREGSPNHRDPGLEHAEALLAAAPQLRVFATNLYDAPKVDAVRRALRNEAPFGPLRVVRLGAHLDGVDEAGTVAFAADVAAHAWLEVLALITAPLNTPAALDAVVDAALARRMHGVELYNCSLSGASIPALARLLGSDALTSLVCVSVRALDAPSARVLGAALRANSTLTHLSLKGSGVFRDVAAGAELLGALTGHASVRVLELDGNAVRDDDQAAAAGASLGALVAANAAALTELDVSECDLGDDGLRALFEALPHNTHLRTLSCSNTDITEAFVCDVLLPAVRANTSLRALVTGEVGDSAAEAERIVSSRAAA